MVSWIQATEMALKKCSGVIYTSNIQNLRVSFVLPTFRTWAKHLVVTLYHMMYTGGKFKTAEVRKKCLSWRRVCQRNIYSLKHAVGRFSS
jgi:hypothetical protein